jgi:Na+:H+ antiporter, NhaA family
MQWWRRDDAGAFTLTFGVGIAVAWSAITSHGYEHIINFSFPARAGSFGVGSPHDLIVNVVMVIFFYPIGLELAREIHHGALRRPRAASAPVAGALGGMLVPAVGLWTAGALVHIPALRTGWGVPMSTDVAFALGMVALVAKGAPPTLRLFVLTLAVADDVTGVVLLAATSATHATVSRLLVGILLAVVGLLLAPATGRSARVRAGASLTLLAGGALTLGVSTSVAAVGAGLAHRAFSPERDQLERSSVNLAVLVALPLFGLVAGGVHWSDALSHGSGLRIVLATMGVRVIGKMLGITSFVYLARRFGAHLPAELGGSVLVALSVLCSMGVTVPLFFAAAHFRLSSVTYSAFTLGLLLASLFGAIVGGVALRASLRHREERL